jgi:acetylornithine deacetylase/succinyl-diaminopimelate desuccinylase-like protein
MTEAGAIDWAAVEIEAVDILRRYLRIDTRNPPGNEAQAARFLGALLEAEGVRCDYLVTAPGREILVARIPGDGSLRPLMLANHTDVVPVEEEHWSHPPFGAEQAGGRIYGRGAVDMKGCAVMQLLAVLLARRRGLELRRDLIFCALPDEEVGSDLGMAWLCEHHPALVDVEFELNEGAVGQPAGPDGEPAMIAVAVAEKEMCELRLVAQGRAGHASQPHENNAALHLVRALGRLEDWERGLTFTASARDYVERLAEAGRLPPLAREEALRIAVEADPERLALFTNTLNVTMLSAGVKSNVIPARAEATLDCRLLPGTTPEEWVAAVEERIDDDRVRVERKRRGPPLAMPTSPWESALVEAIRGAVAEELPGAVVVPTTSVYGTDNRFLRPRGVAAYGLIPALLSEEERRGFHGPDEFITEENLALGCRLMYGIVRRACT